MLRKYTVAMLQMDTQNDKGENLKQACAWIDEAAARGAKLICFPEVMNLIGRNVGEGGGKEQIRVLLLHLVEKWLKYAKLPATRQRNTVFISREAALRRRIRENEDLRIPVS